MYLKICNKSIQVLLFFLRLLYCDKEVILREVN